MNKNILPLEETDFTFDEQEKVFFVNEKGEVAFDIDENDIKHPIFADNDKRLKCLEFFLGIHSLKIYNSEKNEDSKYLSLTFNGDREIYDVMMKLQNHETEFVWKTEEEMKNVPNIENFKDLERPFIVVVLTVNHFGTENILYQNVFRINSWEIYAEVLLPWTIKDKNDQPMVVYLSSFQKDTFFKDGGSKVDFFPTELGLEPIIIDHELKSKIIGQISNYIYDILRKEEASLDDKVIILEFKNGDRDLISAVAGTINYKYHSLVESKSLKDKPFFDKIKDSPISVWLIVHKPNSDDILYSSVSGYSEPKVSDE